MRIKNLIIIISIGFLYYIWIKLTGISIPCVFYKLTGFLCPGCGITKLFLALFKFDIYGAFKANSFIFVTSPFIIFEMIFSEKLKENKINRITLIIYIILLILFGIIRNIIKI